ncbi:MAG: tRNA lysidine(34) synthetase TilS [Synergistaceae bacterium]
MDNIVQIRKKIKETAVRQGWWNSRKILVALSGGGDSVALLWLLNKFYNGKIIAAHLDHMTRNGESHLDALFAKKICEEWGIDFVSKTVDIEKNCIKGESFEMAARRVRYEFFNEIARKNEIDFISIGHSADDLIETQIMNLFRGTGILGLRGIPETRDNIIRPIIDFRREELRDILRSNNIEWREDYTNKETVYTRNKIREELFPWIKQNLNPNFEISLIGLAKEIDAETKEKLEKAEKNLSSVNIEIKPAIATWDAKLLKRFSDNELKQMIRLQGKKLNLPVLSRKKTDILCALIKKEGCWRFQWACDIEVCYSLRGIGWLHRHNVEESIKKEKNKKEILPWWAI